MEKNLIANYLEKNCLLDINHFMKNNSFSTGFSSLDSASNGLYTGLYVVGAMSGIGKTTFIHQLVDQVVSNGEIENVIFFSLEQSKLELTMKSLYREYVFMSTNDNFKNIMKPISVSEKYYEIHKNFEILKNKYLSKNIHNYTMVCAGENSMSILDIENIISEKMDSNKIENSENNQDIKYKNSLIVIDYLQIIENNLSFSTREAVNYNIMKLKKISRKYNIPVIVISSINRSSYTIPIDFESFKESGDIEYTADVIWGLQFTDMSEANFEKKDLQERKNIINNAKNKMPRSVELICLKNRFGVSGYSIPFAYFPHYDLFIESNSLNKGNNDKVSMKNNQKNTVKR